MALTLRGYQERSLEALETFLREAERIGDAQRAFVLQTGRPYVRTPRMPGLPYVCLRVPTGGGKTLMAAHAIGIAAQSYLHAEHPLCLWLVPSNAIREQTLGALTDRSHSYRQALEAQFPGAVRVLSLSDALDVRPSVLSGETCVVVSTLAALRVEDTDGRKVYEEAGALQDHFTGLSAEQAAALDCWEHGRPIYSLANVLRLRRPLILVDEAHNARTPLSFDTLERFRPSCVLEFTATPATEHKPSQGMFPSNVLHHVSAAELKAEEMIKLPIKLETREDWHEALSDALQARHMLEGKAREEQAESGEYLRPIMLIQAQPKSATQDTLTVDVVRRSLIADFKIGEADIAVATGETKGLAGVNLSAPDCPIRYVLTVQALKEGWDCPFAYVLCSVANIHSPRAVEQVLGRVLRMPGARRKTRPELNCAYAYVASSAFAATAQSLKEALVENGFERFDADRLVVPNETQPLPLIPVARQPVSTPPDLSALPSDLRQRVTYREGARALEVEGALTAEQRDALKGCFVAEQDQAAMERLYQESQGRRLAAPAPAPVTIQVPALAAHGQGELELFEDSHFLSASWNLAECDPTLTAAEFDLSAGGGAAAQVDVTAEGKLAVEFVTELHKQLDLLGPEPNWTVAGLANWLDRKIPHRDIPQSRSSLFIHRALAALMEARGVSVEELARRKFRLRDSLAAKIDEHRDAQRRKSYQLALSGALVGELSVDPSLCITLSEDRYDPNTAYTGADKFNKHAFSIIGNLKPDGEEFECAAYLDRLEEIDVWVRNLERRPDSAFWLQTSTDKFYPDFVARLKDGRILVVEYKSDRDWSNDDSKEKRALGELWAERSKGRCIFAMPKGPDYAAIKAAFAR